jgi:hypothetical protein
MGFQLKTGQILLRLRSIKFRENPFSITGVVSSVQSRKRTAWANYIGAMQFRARLKIGNYFFSMALPAHSGPWSLIQFRNHFCTDGRTPWTSDQLVARSLPKHRTQTQNKRIHTSNIHALSGIWNHDPSVWASEGSSCLRPRGYCGRQIIK